MPADLFIRALGSRPVERTATAVLGGRLRVLAYHDVVDEAAFEAQVRHLVDHYRPVDAAAVVAAVSGSASLPPRAVWVTFDDGFAGVVERGLPVLERLGITATLFVCPWSIDAGGRPLWAERAAAALARGWRPPGTEGQDAVAALRALKRWPDTRRRETMAAAPEAADTAPMVDERLLARWVDAGQHVGNHTWDHPCLDTCDPPEQRRQIAEARAWLDARFPGQPAVFAYPNGDWTSTAAAAAADVGEQIGALFDHRLADPSGDCLRLSRLRVDADAPLDRFRAIVSGAHSAAFGLVRRRREPRGDRSTR
jgi:peptidoglycan/xylan/chitin deacetylase (PgdA/CDA1 family)